MNIRKLHFGRRSAWIAGLVAANGLIIIMDTLFGQFDLRRLYRREMALNLVVDVPLLLGLTLLYISLSLMRRKRTAWIFAVIVYAFMFGMNAGSVLFALRADTFHAHFTTLLLVPVMLGLLWLARRDFVVRSDTQTFVSSLKVAAVVLVTALLYGVGGYLLMDNRDFHQEVSPLSAVHYTVDQFDLTTNSLHAYTRRAVLFQDSLTFISVTAVGFVLISLFQPLRARYIHHAERARLAQKLVHSTQADSEDFFKLWPQDKEYFLSHDGKAGLAYKVQRGVALVVGDPLGSGKDAVRLLRQFEEQCFVNDWRPAFIHITPAWRRRFESRGYQVQLIGKEAIVDTHTFETSVMDTKYFRQIQSRFDKLGFSTELLRPPHHEAIIGRLQAISNEWLKRPGRTERRFMMGYFSPAYMQQCDLFIARDAAGTIQAFINVLPTVIPEEANFDLLRASDQAPGNTNDYLLLQLLRRLQQAGIQRLNMGLCPLVGIEDAPDTLINRTLRFVYSNGDRFYSFKGLYKFKAKYEPHWSERYIAYKGNPADFVRVMRALAKAMKI